MLKNLSIIIKINTSLSTSRIIEIFICQILSTTINISLNAT